MTTRNTPATGNQTLVWNNADQLKDVAAGSTHVSYIYDADGNVLIKTDPTSKTLYLSGEQITLNTTTSTTTGVRYLPLPGGGTAVRTGTGSNYSFEITDPHGTSDLYLDSTAQTPTWRQFTPYGAPRGTTTTWLDDRGFLNKPADTTSGLTDVGAREYDPATGAFISLDPVFEATDPEQLNGYDYSGDNPVSHSDPTGKMLAPVDGGSGYCNTQCQQGDPVTVSPSGGSGSGSGSGGGGSGGTHHKHHGSSWAPHWVTSAAHGVSDGFNSAADFTSDVFNPDIVIGATETVGSLYLMGLSETGIEAGAGLCATGLGCFAGAPLVAVSATGIVAGAYGSVDGAKKFGQGIHQALSEANDGSGGSQANVPNKAEKTLEYIDEHGDHPPGFKGGRTFKNLGKDGEEKLPEHDSGGDPITYQEWDVNPYTKGVNRGSQRLVTGSDGSARYTKDHYRTYTQIR